jgi:hypothetical protein
MPFVSLHQIEKYNFRRILLAIIEARKTGKGIDANNHLTVSAESYSDTFFYSTMKRLEHDNLTSLQEI